jgi:hypothetical protein
MMQQLGKVEKCLLLLRYALKRIAVQEYEDYAAAIVKSLAKAATRSSYNLRILINVHFDIHQEFCAELLQHTSCDFEPNDNPEFKISFTYDNGVIMTIRGATFIYSTVFLPADNDVEVTYNYAEAICLLANGKQMSVPTGNGLRSFFKLLDSGCVVQDSRNEDHWLGSFYISRQGSDWRPILPTQNEMLSLEWSLV